MSYSSDVTAGVDVVLATQYNDLRKDALGIITPNAAVGGLAQYDAVYILAAGTAGKANANAAGTAKVRGISLTAVAGGAASTIQTRGPVTNAGWAWTPGAEIYLNTSAGTLTETPPSIVPGADIHIVRVGWASAATTILIDIRAEN